MAFTGNDPKDTYLGILTLGDDGGIPPVANSLHPTTLQPVLDAAGAASLLALSQDKVGFTGIMEASVSGLVMDSGVPLESDDLVTNQVLDKTDNNVGIIFTTGNPEGSLVAGIGSLALRKDGSSGTSLYIKESGVGDTGWTAVDIIPTFLDLTDTPNLYVAEKWVRVNEDGDALEFVDPPTVALGNFNELNDCPPSYEGFGGFVVAVNLAESGLTFTNAAVGALTDLSDTPAALIDSGILACNSDATAVEFIGTSATLGDILFFDGTVWTTLGAGTAGQVLTTQGVVADPTWETPSGGLPTTGGIMTGNIDFQDDEEGIRFWDQDSAFFNGVSFNLGRSAVVIGGDAVGLGGYVPIIADSMFLYTGVNDYTAFYMWHAVMGDYAPIIELYSAAPDDPLFMGTLANTLTLLGSTSRPMYDGGGGAEDIALLSDVGSGGTLTGLTDTPADYGIDGQVLVTDGVDTITWGDMTAGYPSNPEEYDVIDLQWSLFIFPGLHGTVRPSKESVTGSYLATGDGTTNFFSGGGELFNTDPGSIAISVLLTDANTALITDDGEGHLEDVANGISGSVTYYSGDWDLTFSGAVPENLADMTADYDAYNGAPVLRVTAYDMIRVIHGGWAPFEYGMRLSGDTDPVVYQANSKDAYVEFTCGNLGQTAIEVWLKDAAGNEIYNEAFINVSDTSGYLCSP